MKLSLVVAALALCATVSAQNLNIDIPYQKFVLDNGLTVIVHEDHKAPIVAVNVWYHVGSKNERPGKTGFAHLFEHLMFGGSEHVKTRYISAMERIGATDLNGTTSNDRTNYFETVPTSALDYTLFLESDRMGHLLGYLDQTTLDLQRGVVQNEKRQGENQPYGVVDQLITDGTYPARHPYSWTVIGSMEDLNAASLDDVQGWFKTYYGPSNAVLVLAGDIDAKTAREKVSKYFGDIPSGPPVAHHEAWVAKMTGEHRQRVQDRVPQARIYKIWNVSQYGAKDTDDLRLVAACLSEGKTSRLYKRLVYDEQIATNVAAYVDEREIGSQFHVQATVRPGQDLAKVEAAINQEMDRFLRNGPTAGELDRVKTQYTAGFVRGLDRVGGFGGKSDTLAIGQAYLGNPDAYKQQLEHVAQATSADLKSAAKMWLSDGEFILEVYPFPAYKTAGSQVDRSTLPEPGTPPDAKLPRLQRASLSNGLKVIVAERHEIPVVNCSLLVDAGYAADQFSNAGTAALAMRVLTAGTRSRNALQISDEISSLGAELNAYSNLDESTVRLSAMKPKLDASLALFADVILNPAFPEPDFQREKKQLLSAIDREKVSPVQMALRVFPGLLYGKGHAYGNPLTGSGTTESATRIGRDDLVKFHQTWFRPNAATLVVVGDTTLAEIRPKLEKLFAGWKAAAVPKKNLASVPLPEKARVYVVDRPGALQSVIMAGQVAPPRNNPREIALGLFNDVIGGMFSSRLNMNLREDKHWSYGASTFLWDAIGQSPFIAFAPVQTDKTKESLAEMTQEFHGILGQRPVTPVELKQAQDAKTLALPGSHETIDSVGGSIEDLVHFGFPDDYYDTYAAKVRAVATPDVEDSGRAVLDPDKLIWVVVGDRAKIEPGIRELNLGEIHFIDADGNPM